MKQLAKKIHCGKEPNDPLPPKVVVTNWVHPEVLELLSRHAVVEPNLTRVPWSRERVIEACADATVLMAFMSDQVDEEFLAACPSLRMIGCALKGYDNFDIEACRNVGVTVSIVPDLLTDPTAELAVCLLIALCRNVLPSDVFVRSGRFQGWSPQFYGTGLMDSLVGIIGMGAVGMAVAKRLRPFGCDMVYADPCGLSQREEAMLGVRRDELHELARSCDCVMVCAPLAPDTKHMINAEFMARMKTNALLVNVGRGSVVDEAAVAEALACGRLGGYAADVFEMEDWARKDRPPHIHPDLISDKHRTLLTSHIGSAVDSVRLEIALQAAQNIIQFLSGERPNNAIFHYSEPMGSLRIA